MKYLSLKSSLGFLALVLHFNATNASAAHQTPAGFNLLWDLGRAMATFNKSGGARHSLPSIEEQGNSCSYLSMKLEQSTNLADEIFSSHLCVKNFPTNPDHFFQKDFDIPAETFGLWTPQYLYDRMSDNAKDNQLKDKVDLQALHDLNLEAATLWQRMVSCAEHNPETAREFYFYNDFRCTEGTDTDISNDLTSLHQNIVTFIRTSDFSSLQRDFAEKRAIIQLHPLLMQAFEELLAVWFPTEQTGNQLRGWTKRNAKTPARLQMATRIQLLLPMLERFESAPVGLWPIATKTAHLYYLAKFENIFSKDGFAVTRVASSAVFSPLDPLIYRPDNRSFFHNWLTPIGWLDAITWSLEGWFSGMGNLEPSSITDGSDNIYTQNSAFIIETTRKIASRYGITRKILWQASDNP